MLITIQLHFLVNTLYLKSFLKPEFRKNLRNVVNTILTLLAESLRSFLDKSGKRKRRFLPLPDLSRKIEGDSVRRVYNTVWKGLFPPCRTKPVRKRFHTLYECPNQTRHKHSTVRTCLYKEITSWKYYRKGFSWKVALWIFPRESKVGISRLYRVIKLIVTRKSTAKEVSFEWSPRIILSTDSKVHVICIWLWIKQLSYFEYFQGSIHWEKDLVCNLRYFSITVENLGCLITERYSLNIKSIF